MDMHWFSKILVLSFLHVVIENKGVSGNDLLSGDNQTNSGFPEPNAFNTGCQNGTHNSTDCVKEDSHSSPISTNVDYIGYVVVPSFLVLGLVGNSLTIAVMCTKHFRHMSVSIVLIALSVSDTILICLHPHNKLFVRNLLGMDIRSQTLVGCKFFFLFFRTAKMSSSWLVVLLSLERFIAVVFPLKAKFWCTKKNVILGISIIYGGLILYNGTWTFASRIVNGKCVPHYPEPADLSHTFIVIGTLLYSIIPVSMMMILTPIVCFHLKRRIKNQSTMRATNAKISDEVKRTTVMLLGVSIAYMFLITPISIGHMISFTHDESIFETKHAGLAIYREISQILEQLNYSINFFLYVLCSKSFRSRVWIVLRCKKLEKNTNLNNKANTTKTTPSASKTKSSGLNENVVKQVVDINHLEVVVETEPQNDNTTVGTSWLGNDFTECKPKGNINQHDEKPTKQSVPSEEHFTQPPTSVLETENPSP